MRVAALLATLLLAPAAAAAQPDRRAPDTDEPVTVRGCLSREAGDWVLRANDRQHQAFGAADWVDRGRRFALGGDPALLDELDSHARHELEVTGHLSIPGPESIAIIERPGGVGGRPADPFGRPGGDPPTDPFGASGPGRGRVESVDPDGVTFLLVTGFEHIGLDCRQ